MEWNEIHQQISSRDLGARSPSAIISEMSDEELRKLILELVESTPARQHVIRCPFRVLNTLAYATYTNLVRGLDRAAMLSMLETERQCLGRHEQNTQRNNDGR